MLRKEGYLVDNTKSKSRIECTWQKRRKERARMWECRICSHENEDNTTICSECGSYQHEDLDAISDEEDV